MIEIKPPTLEQSYLPIDQLFIAGGISGCPDWQQQLVQMLNECPCAIFNPRRDNFDTTNPAMAYDQIIWEEHHLELANHLSFWFPAETLCPITLFELGKYVNTSQRLFIGMDRNYKRRFDVETQVKIVRGEFDFVYSLEDLATQLKVWLA